MQVEEGVDRYRAEVAGWCMVEVSILSNAWCCTRVMVAPPDHVHKTLLTNSPIPIPFLHFASGDDLNPGSLVDDVLLLTPSLWSILAVALPRHLRALRPASLQPAR